MKKLSGIFAIFYLATLSPAMAAKLLNHGGYVYDNNNNAIPGAAVTCSNTITTGTYTNVGGHFSINCPADEGITVSFTGHKDQTIPVDELDTPTSHGHVSNNRITLVDDATAIEEVTVRGCEINTAQGVKHASYNEQTGECVIDECITPKYALNNGECVLVDNSCIDELRYKQGVKEAKWTSDDFGDAVCEVTQCDTENGWTMGSTTDQCYVDVGAPCTLPGAEYVRSGIQTTTWADKNSTPKCTVTECKSEYKLKTLYNGEPWCVLKDDCMDTLPDKTGVSSAKYDDKSGTAVCTITSCQYPQYKLIGGVCVDQTGQDCDDKNNNVGTWGMFKKEFTCILSECSDLTQEVDTKTNTCTSLLNQKCSPMHDDNVANAVWEEHNGTKVCVIKSCKNKYRTNAAGTKCEPIPKECTSADKQTIMAQTGVIAAGLNASEKCVPTDCKCGYTLKNEKCVEWTAADKACTDNVNGAKTFEKQCSDKGKPYCQILSCEADYTEVKKNNKITKCASKRGEDCINTLSSQQRSNAKTAHYKTKDGKNVCVIDTCIDGYEPDKSGTKCVPECECGQEYNESTNKCVPWTDTACNDTQKPKLPSHATSGEKKCNGKRAYCEVTACDDGFKVSDDKKSCTNVRGDECDATAIDKNATAGKYKKSNGEMTCVIQECARGFEPNKSGTKCVAKNVLSEEESQKKIDELRENAENMKAKEQSTENKLLGAAGIGATGIGGMMLASGMAEQNADADAETAMKAYLATFHCNYGGGKNVPHGTENVELPGGNELIALYTEYVNLANDLKARKADLGMAPGIESEAILESATSGLYDDVAVGKTSGAYVSLARALMDPEGEDAKLWAEQKDKTAQQIKTGAITAGVGAAGSLIGNLAINSGKDKQNKVDEILNKYNKLKKPFDNLEEKVKQVTPETKPCPSDATGSAHPNCTCRDTSKVYNPNNATCEACTGGRINVENQCKCPENLPQWDESGGKCVANPQACTPQCTPTEGSHLVLDKTTCQCSCSDGFDLVNGTCQCNNPKSVNESGKCVQVEVKTIEKVLNQTTITNDTTLPASNLFKIGSYELLAGAKTALDSFVSELGAEGISDCEITIVGYTDPVGAVATNQRLSEQRANSVRQYLENKRSGSIKAITSSGHGENNCTCGIRTENMDYSNRDYSVCKDKEDTHPVSGDARYAPCRRVEISAKCKQTSTTGGFVDGLVDGLTGK